MPSCIRMPPLDSLQNIFPWGWRPLGNGPGSAVRGPEKKSTAQISSNGEGGGSSPKPCHAGEEADATSHRRGPRRRM